MRIIHRGLVFDNTKNILPTNVILNYEGNIYKNICVHKEGECTCEPSIIFEISRQIYSEEKAKHKKH